MASQPISRGKEDIASLDVQSYVRGYHAYQDIWDPFIGEVLPLEREPNNSEDRFAVAIKRSDVVGHLPFNLTPVVSAFLRRGINKGLVEVTGVKVNCARRRRVGSALYISLLWIEILHRQTEEARRRSSE